MPTDYGFTGQRVGSATGLDYYGARYYDPLLGQFTSADTVADGLNRYGYVKGNPTTYTDPTGHKLCLGDTPSSCLPTPRLGNTAGDPIHKTLCYNKALCGGSGGNGTGNGTGGRSNGTSGGCTSDANCGCYQACGAPAGSSCGGCNIAGTPVPMVAPSQSIHVSSGPQNFWDWGEFAKAVFHAGAAVFLILAAFSSREANPLAAIAFFVNGVDQLIHAAASIAKITAGESSGAYRLLASLGVTADYVATLTDVIALDPEAAAEEIVLPPLKDTNALSALGTLLGIDLISDIDDFKDLITANAPTA